MELLFENKESYDQIIKRAENIIGQIKEDDQSLIIHGENFDVMAKMLKHFRGKIDLVYIDPPFSTDQVFSLTDSRVSTVSRAKKGKIAYADVMTKDEYLKFMYERFVLIRELLSNKGSLYVHIDVKRGHYFKIMLDEIFGESNFRNDITRIKSNPKNFDRKAFGNEKDVILFYTKTQTNIWNDVRIQLNQNEIVKRYDKIDENGRRYTTIPLHAPGETSQDSSTGQPWRGMNPPEGRHWRTDPTEFDRLDSLGLIEWSSTGNPRIKKFADEHCGKKIQDIWTFKDPQYPLYPTEKNQDMIELIVKQSSNEDSIVLDCFAGGGTTLRAALANNRRFIGIDKSETAIEVMKKRIDESKFKLI